MTDKTVQGVIDQLDDYINNNSNLLDRLRYLDSVGCKVKVFVNVSGSVTLPRNWIEVE